MCSFSILGLTIADLVFPWFIFIMGTSINLSYQSFIKHSQKLSTALLQILFRSIKLFVIGLVLNKGKLHQFLSVCYNKPQFNGRTSPVEECFEYDFQLDCLVVIEEPVFKMMVGNIHHSKVIIF